MSELNVFWPVFRQLDYRAAQLTQDIHVCDDQLDVYSSTIADIVIRCGVEIEAIVKELSASEAFANAANQGEGAKTDHVHFDDLLKALLAKWKLDKKVVYVSHHGCFQSQKTLYPFLKDTPRTGKSRQTFGWNNAYQNLKHNRQKYLSSGSLQNMFSALAATYLLNLYFKDEVHKLGHESSASAMDATMGSELFSIEIATDSGWNEKGHPNVPKNYEASAVCITSTEETRLRAAEAMSSAIKEGNELFVKQVLTEAVKGNSFRPEEANSLSIETMRYGFANHQHSVKMAMRSLKYEARMNKHFL